jgi:hypothetical protein
MTLPKDSGPLQDSQSPSSDAPRSDIVSEVLHIVGTELDRQDKAIDAGPAHFAIKGGLTAKLGRIPYLHSLAPEGQRHKHGFIQKLTKGKWTEMAILALHPDLPRGLRPTELRGAVNAWLRKQSDYTWDEVNAMMIRRALDRLYALKAAGRLTLPP